MQDQHMNPDDAVQAIIACEAEAGLGVHWGTFQLTDEPQHAPVAALAVALAAHGVADGRLRAMHPGEVWPSQISER
jgi:L-ascorbate metabolism protein UlaG (beta-lactamase superfamily)